MLTERVRSCNASAARSTRPGVALSGVYLPESLVLHHARERERERECTWPPFTTHLRPALRQEQRERTMVPGRIPWRWRGQGSAHKGMPVVICRYLADMLAVSCRARRAVDRARPRPAVVARRVCKRDVDGRARRGAVHLPVGGRGGGAPAQLARSLRNVPTWRLGHQREGPQRPSGRSRGVLGASCSSDCSARPGA
jgi:hypothetical protein